MKDFLKKYVLEITAVCFVFALYSMALSFGFLENWDDSSYILHTNLLFTWENLVGCLKHCPQGFYAPLTMYSFILDHLMWGLNPFGYHLSNILLLCGSLLLLISIFRRIGIDPLFALLCSLTWSVSPQRVESVVWIAERKDVLSCFFALLSLLVFMVEFDHKKWPVGGFLIYVLALLAKPSVIGLPLIFAFYVIWRKKISVLAGLRWGLLALVPAVVCCLFLLRIMPVYRWLESPARILTIVSHNFAFYIVNTLIPIRLNPVYPLVEFQDLFVILIFLILAVLLLVFLFKIGFSRDEIFFSSLSFVILYSSFFITVTGGFRFNATDYADRYSILPSLAVWWFAAWIASKLIREKVSFRRPVMILFLLLIAIYSIRTILYIPSWRSDRSLSRYALFASDRVNDKACLFAALSGWTYHDPESLNLAAGFLAENSKRCFPRDNATSAGARINSALVFQIMQSLLSGKKEEALNWYRTLRIRLSGKDNAFLESHLYLSSWREKMYLLLGEKGKPGELDDFLNWCSKLGWNEKSPIDLFYCGLWAFRKGNYAESVRVWRKAVILAPDDRSLQKNLEIAEKLAAGH